MARNKYLKMHFKWTYARGAIVRRLGFGKDLNRVFAETLVKYAYDFTPWAPKEVSGSRTQEHLRDSAHVEATDQKGIITYPGIPYARYQNFHSDANWHRYTPGTTSRWLDYAWTVYKPQITGTVGAYRRWHSV